MFNMIKQIRLKTKALDIIKVIQIPTVHPTFCETETF